MIFEIEADYYIYRHHCYLYLSHQCLLAWCIWLLWGKQERKRAICPTNASQVIGAKNLTPSHLVLRHINAWDAAHVKRLLKRFKERWVELAAVPGEPHLLSLRYYGRSLGQISSKPQGQARLGVLYFTHAVCILLVSPIQQLFNCGYTNPNTSGSVPSTQLCKPQVPNIYSAPLFMIIAFDPKPMKFLPAQAHCLSTAVQYDSCPKRVLLF